METAFAKVPVLFLAPTLDSSQQTVTPASGNPEPSSGLHGHLHVPPPPTLKHTHN